MSEHSSHDIRVTPIRSPEAEARVRAEVHAFESQPHAQRFGRQAIVRSLDAARERKQQRDNREQLAEIDELKREYKDKIQQAVSEGWPIPDPDFRIYRLDTVNVQYGDVTASGVADAGRSAVYWYTGEPHIIVSEDRSSYDLRETLSHEWTHVLSNDHKAAHNRFELFEELLGPNGGTVVNEALTEHLTQSLLYGEFDTLHPDKRGHHEDDPMYARERVFMDMLLAGGDRQTSLKLVYEKLYFSQQDSVVDFTHDNQVQQLLLKIDSAFPGVNVMTRLRKFETDEEFDELYADVEAHVRRRAAEREQHDSEQDNQLLDELFSSVEKDQYNK